MSKSLPSHSVLQCALTKTHTHKQTNTHKHTHAHSHRRDQGMTLSQEITELGYQFAVVHSAESVVEHLYMCRHIYIYMYVCVYVYK